MKLSAKPGETAGSDFPKDTRAVDRTLCVGYPEMDEQRLSRRLPVKQETPIRESGKPVTFEAIGGCHLVCLLYAYICKY